MKDSPVHAPREAWGWLVLIAVAVGAAYAPAWQIPLLFDDLESITRNPSLRPPWHWSDLLSPPESVPTRGRPLANLTFAFSFAVSGLRPWGHHAVNLAIHCATAWTLFGVIRRTLAPSLAGGPAAATRLAGLASLLWAVHPALVQSVSYLSQRTEVMMACFALVTLYGFIRWTQENRSGWAGISVAAALMGALSKEGFVTVPLLILAYDRTFVAGSLRVAWRLRRSYYAALAVVWPLIFALLADVGSRGVGMGQGITAWDYARTQLKAWTIYLQLVVWPHPLIFDRGTQLVRTWGEALPYLLLPLVVGAAAIGWFWRRTVVGFLLTAFVLLLVPTSSVVPVAGATIAENRLYLPAAVVVIAVVGAAWGRWPSRVRVPVFVLLALVAGAATANRNLSFRDAEGLWRQTVARAPENARAHHNLGQLLAQDQARREEARRCYEEALRLQPDYALAHQNLGILRSRQGGGLADGVAHLQEAVRLEPGLAAAHSNLGGLLAQLPGRETEAMWHHDQAVRLNPRLAEVWYNRGNALARDPRRWGEALEDFARALALDPTMAEAHANRGGLLMRMPNRSREADAEFAAALRLRPNFAEVQLAWADLLAARGDALAEARRRYEEALRLQPDLAAAHFGFGNLLAASPDTSAAAGAHFEAALRLNPNLFEAHANLAAWLERAPPRLAEALEHHRRAVELAPDNAIVHFSLANCLERIGGPAAEVREHYAAALRLAPGLEPARAALRRLGEAPSR